MGDATIIPNAQWKTPHPERHADASATPPAYRGDVAIYRMVVAVLGLVTLAATAGALVCEMSSGREIPQLLIALGSGALGALGGLLAPSPMGSGR